jgi:hypothetical protein
MGLSENRVYSQWNSHLIGIMISKTLGLGVHYFQTHPIGTINHQMVTCTCWRRNKSSRLPRIMNLKPRDLMTHHIAPTYRYVSQQPKWLILMVIIWLMMVNNILVKCNTLKNTLLTEPTFEVLNDQTKHRSSFVPMVRYGMVCV